ncbi:Uncharacterised protein [Mycobacteroides abscessus subsp. abscessus]|nr:Uncharacterised protein [Mycobacteroides abscessus subsp. abscessus]
MCEKTLTPSAGASRSRGHVVEVFCTQTETSGGSSETVVNADAAMPSGASAVPRQHTATTPVGKQLYARLSAPGSDTGDRAPNALRLASP